MRRTVPRTVLTSATSISGSGVLGNKSLVSFYFLLLPESQGWVSGEAATGNFLSDSSFAWPDRIGLKDLFPKLKGVSMAGMGDPGLYTPIQFLP